MDVVDLIPEYIWSKICDHLNVSGITSLSLTCRKLYFVINSDLFWSRLIYNQFGDKLRQRYLLDIFTSGTNDKSDMLASIETKTLYDSCLYGKTTFSDRNPDNYYAYLKSCYLLNECNRYILNKLEPVKTKMCLSVNNFRSNIHYHQFKSEYLTCEYRSIIPLAKLMYFYLIDQKRVAATDMISFDNDTHPTEKIAEITCLNGYYVRVDNNIAGELRGIFHSVVPGNYEIIWRLKVVKISDKTDRTVRFNGLCEFQAIPDYGIICKKSFSSTRRSPHWFSQMEMRKDWYLQSTGTFVIYEMSTVYFSTVISMLPYWPYAVDLDYVELKVVHDNNSNFMLRGLEEITKLDCPKLPPIHPFHG
ncbi:unnamed protein product [Didymodactylos carnosus]|uniref:F-box domain-containing protein n=1 Tax=Didymodactylos carnosus TaxID=1234261 RepID=A0A8S2REV8_9BILA|nr:unnamed protein product [Didymodactylos carnosus]CAF4159172.1 unnamed protein product [Didymodactylos carnosus]